MVKSNAKKLIGNFKSFWYQNYGVIIPVAVILCLITIKVRYKFNLTLICKNNLFSDMLTALITCMSIIISIFGFLIPSLISAKNDKMVKYFIENADMNLFVRKIKSVIFSGLTGILLSVLLYLNADFNIFVLQILLYLWIGIILNFACNSYRFISLIISLLLTEKEAFKGKKCANEFSEEEDEALNAKIQSFD